MYTALKQSVPQKPNNWLPVLNAWKPKANRLASGPQSVNRIVTEDESWMQHYQPESKRASVQWKHPSSPSAKKCKVTPLCGKVMLTVFWDSQGVLLAHFQKHGENMNSVSYCEVLLRLQDAICRKHSGQLARGVLHNTMPDPIQPK
jgi:hypothetical protein